MQNFELLAPAGNMNKLKTALYFGADAVYVGGKSFSMRSNAGNFSNEELLDAVRYTHSLSKKFYVTVNIFARPDDFEEAEKYFRFLATAEIDGVIVSDVGLIALCREVAPSLELHISTQANVLNGKAVEFWAKQGAKRVVLGREATLNDIVEIHKQNPTVELEAFVHGAMCVSYSGRCLLSNHLISRDANRGNCAQPCRWRYLLSAVDGDGKQIEVEEDERGTYFMNSKDLNLLAHLKELKNAGICSLKIEGRMKSEFYVATVVNAYRHAIDELEKYGEVKNVNDYLKELDKVYHHPYTEAFLFGQNLDTISYNQDHTDGEYEFCAVVLEGGNDFAEVEMRNRFKVGEELEILSPSQNNGKQFFVEPMLDGAGNEVLDALLVQQKLKMKIPFEVFSGDILRRKCKQN